jgi:hypothetical protein
MKLPSAGVFAEMAFLSRFGPDMAGQWHPRREKTVI